MAETIFDRINATVDLLNTQLDEANAVILDRQRILGKLKFNKLMAAKVRPISTQLSKNKSLYDSRISNEEYLQYLDTLDQIPTIVGNLQSATKKVSGWRISIGQLVAAIIRQLYGLLKSDIIKMPEMKPFHDMVSECFPQPGPRKPKPDDETKEEKGNGQ